MTDLSDLIARIEAASGPCIGLDADIELATGNWSEHHHEAWQRYQECGEAVNPPLCVPVNPNRFTASIDAALTLVPKAAINIDIHSHTRDGGKPAWSVAFLDTSQKMGKRAAKEQIARMRKAFRPPDGMRGQVAIVLEKAIAEHFLEFHATANTPALALCAAALRARMNP